ncbi:purine-cytosine permease family protein [Streptomyces chattanoogensis]|uniref:Thiamine permease n=1 Tax=Streptomyces chattanoogensis TaxID=66876 RepID=A0A0N0GW10_9ACTN|nr:cytosine permease [Streptomyces chattanoogensis]KPC59749.1 thiamine permease [Streptomyces chattanoogensis]
MTQQQERERGGTRPGAHASARTVERNGIDPVPESERHGTPRSLFWPWAASGLSLLCIAYGIYLMGLGLGPWQAIATGTIGYVLSFVLVGLISIAGARTGAPTMAIGRVSFGLQGNKLPTLFSYVSNVGWETVLVALSSLGGAAILARVSPGAFARADGTTPTTAAQALCFGVTAVSVVVVGIFGHALIMKVQKYLTAAITAMTVVYMVLMADRIDPSALGGGRPGDLGTFIGGIVFAMTLLGLGWVNCAADYSRYLPRTSSGRAITGWTTLGGVLAPVVLLVFGVLLNAGDPELAQAAAADPVGALAAELPTWFLVPYLLTAIGGFASGAIMDIYSSGMSMLALGVPVRRHFAVLVDGVLMAVGGWYVLFVSPSFFATFQAFLSIIGVAMAGWTAVFLVEQWRRRRTGFALASVRPMGWPAVLSLALATAVGLGLITSADPHIAKAVGFLLSDRAAHGTLGAMNLGVVVALIVAGVLYAVTAPLAGRAAAGPERSAPEGDR